MTTPTSASALGRDRRVDVPATWETRAWVLMRYSGVLLIPLAWVHVAIQDVLVGVHAIDLDYVALRWATLGWRVYDIALLAFAFAHGINGLRNVLSDYIHPAWARRAVNILLLAGWLIISAIGAVAVIGGVRAP